MPAAAAVAAQRPGLAYFRELESAFEAAASARCREVDLEIAGHAVRMRYASDGLLRSLGPALEHHPRSAPGAPALTICAFESIATGGTLPPFPWSPIDVRERGEVRGFNDDRVRTLYDTESGLLSMIDLERRLAFFAVDDERRLTWWQRAAPFRSILHWGLGTSTTFLAHAGAVGSARGCALLAGAGGAGKSTTAVACAVSGLDFAGEDYVIVELGDRPTVHSVFATAKLTPRSLAMIPAVAGAVRPGSLEDEKLVIDMCRAIPQRIRRSMPIAAIVLPRVQPGAPSVMEPTSAAEALRALAPTTIYQLPSNGGLALRPLAELARRIPAYSLTLGEPGAGPRLIARLLEDRRA